MKMINYDSCGDLDIDRLREDMKDDFGTAMMSGMPAAVMDLSKVESASDEELLRMAEKRQMNLRKYMR